MLPTEPTFTWDQFFAALALLVLIGGLLTTTLPDWQERRRERRTGRRS